MPTLNFKGKNIIWNHHQSPLVPTHTLDLNKTMSYNAEHANGNMIIEGDNLLALKALLPEYQGKVDCIYIDPPYNTGNEGWVYNDKVNSPMINEWIGKAVGKEAEDFTRHDKWLCMMTPRLKLLHEMLSDKGVIFVSIDDNEVHHLRMLMNEIWGEENFVIEAPTIMNLKGNQDEFAFAGTHEYTVIFAKDKSNVQFGHFKINEEDIDNDWVQDEKGYYKKGANLKSTGGNAPRLKRPNMFYPIFVSKEGQIYVSENNEPKSKEDHILLPITSGLEMSWRWSKKTVLEDIDDIILSGDKESGFSIYKKQRPSLSDLPSKKPKSIFYKPEYSSGNGTNQIKNIFGDNFFDTPKPLGLIKDFIYIASDKNSIILDSFAGSGTTGQAVLELNKEDSGNRKFILVQMPEEIAAEASAGKYCKENTLPLKISSITRERVKLAIEKKINIKDSDNGEIEGFSEQEEKPKELGFEYFELGRPLDSWSIVNSQTNEELPSYTKLASYIWKNLTSQKKEVNKNPKSKGVDQYYIGDYKGEKVFFLYEQDLIKLQGKELCMTYNYALELETLYPDCPKLIYTPTCYLDEWHMNKFKIRYINYPFGI